ncbi:MAG: hypothetical protein IPL78_30960 [Chloroflexi bacterium]|nr:hypothetical protein [Chloroflexota bacterium]
MLPGVLWLTACGGNNAAASPSDPMTPTLHPYFQPDEPFVTPLPAPDGVITPTISTLFAFVPSPTSKPLPTPRPTSTPTVTFTPTATPDAAATPTATLPATSTPITHLPSDGRFDEIVIFDEELSENWSLSESWDITYTLTNEVTVYTGTVAAAITPEEPFGAIFFTVNPETSEEYLYEDVIGVSFWLNSGDEYLPLDEMAVTILGSNAYPYWDEDDDSVEQVEGERFFSETRLYYLGLNDPLPPNQWVEVIVWLDDLPYDPVYTFITGLYIKNGDNFLEPYFVDRVVLLTGGEE